MRTLAEIIDCGRLDIEAGRVGTVAAMAFCAYQAGISRGDLLMRGKYQEDIAGAKAGASGEHCHFVAARHIPDAPSCVVNPECEEILRWQFDA